MKVKKGISIYIIINTVFLLPIGVNELFDIDFAVAIYAVMILMYSLFFLVYLHIALDSVMLIYLISEKIKKKISSKFLSIYILIMLINIWLNVLCIQVGRVMLVG